VALATTWWALLGAVFLLPAGQAVRLVSGGAEGLGLVPVLQLTGAAELQYALGMLVGLLVG
jgi:1,4-dihydroxy-2-naphthoate polyprenyltransferase